MKNKIKFLSSLCLLSSVSMGQTVTNSSPSYLVKDSTPAVNSNSIYVTNSTATGTHTGTETNANPISLYQDGYPVGTEKNPLTVNITNLSSQLSGYATTDSLNTTLSDYVTSTEFNTEVTNLTNYINSSESNTESNTEAAYLKKTDASSLYLPLTGGSLNNPADTTSGGSVSSPKYTLRIGTGAPLSGTLVAGAIIPLNYIALQYSSTYANLPTGTSNYSFYGAGQKYNIIRFCSDCYSSSRLSTNTTTGIFVTSPDTKTWYDLVGNPVLH